MMDIVYYVRPGDRNDELRYSLRSLSNLPHGRVWIVGHKPPWVTGTEYLPQLGPGSPQQNAVRHLTLAAQEVEADEFVIFNDDFYVMQPVTGVPALHQGLLAEKVRHAGGAYASSLKAALAELGTDAIAWTLHIPVVVRREALEDIISPLTQRIPPEWRTMYGNLTGQVGEQAPDVKVRRRHDPVPDGPFLSSGAATFPFLRRLLDGRFPQPGPYEVTA